jgi:hypothetical protein
MMFAAAQRHTAEPGSCQKVCQNEPSELVAYMPKYVNAVLTSKQHMMFAAVTPHEHTAEQGHLDSSV